MSRIFHYIRDRRTKRSSEADNEQRNILCCPCFPLPLHTNPGDDITNSEQTHNEGPNLPEPADTGGGVPTDANSEASGSGITHSEQPHTQVLNVPGPVNTDEVVNPNPSHESFRDDCNEERNAATAGVTEAPNLNQEATVRAAVAAAAETVPLHPDGTNPIKGESVDTVDEGAKSNDAAHSEEAANSYDHLYVSDVIIKDKSLQDKLARKLDHTPHRVIKTWEHLACTKEVNAPLEIRSRIKLNSENSCTMTLIDFLSVEMGDKTVHELIEALKAINRPDVVEIITAVYSENSTEKIGDFASSNANSEMIKRIATKLDKKSLYNGYWMNLGQQFEISRKKLKEIEYGPSNPALVLMKYLYLKQEDLTVGRFYEEVDKLKRGDVLEELEPFLKDRSQELMKDVIEPESAVMRNICVYLNDPNPAVNNWKYLASAFKVPSEIYGDFNPKEPMSPTNSLFEWIFANKRDLTVGQLCSALKSIERNDVVRDLRKHLEQQSSEQE